MKEELHLQSEKNTLFQEKMNMEPSSFRHTWMSHVTTKIIPQAKKKRNQSINQSGAKALLSPSWGKKKKSTIQLNQANKVMKEVSERH